MYFKRVDRLPENIEIHELCQLIELIKTNMAQDLDPTKLNNGIPDANDEFFLESKSTLKKDFKDADLVVRDVEAKDMDTVRTMFAEGMRLYTKEEHMLPDGPVMKFFEGYITTAVENMPNFEALSKDFGIGAGGAFFVVEDRLNNNELIGMVGIQKLNDNTCELRRLSVKLTSRKCGLGRKLVRLVEDFAAENNFKMIILTTGSIMYNAVALYDKMGYEVYRKGRPSAEFQREILAANEPVEFYEAAYRKPVTSNQGSWVWQPH
eukprot:m.196767 g.196767  ORF g.196767 m.196767 type:complete len:264 (-) comp32633_c0_seq1:305-1096(-)